MIRKNCKRNQNKPTSLLHLQSGHSEKENFFSVVSFNIKILSNISYKIKKYFVFLSSNIYNIADRTKNNLSKLKKEFKNIKNTFDKILNIYKNLKSEHEKNKSVKHLIKAVFNVLTKNKKTIFRFMNYVYPVFGIFIFIVSFNVVFNFEYGLKVDCLDNHIGYVENEYVFFNASKQMNSQINYTKDQLPINDVPKYTLVKLNKKIKCDNKENIANKLLQIAYKDKTICKAHGLYINDDLVCVVKNKKHLQQVLDETINPYKEQYPRDNVSFANDVNIKTGYYLTNSLCAPQNIKNKIAQNDSRQIVYTVKSGDVLKLIAKNNNTSYEQLKQFNPDIKTGESQNKLPLSVKIEQTYSVTESTPFEIEKIEDSNIPNTYCKIVQQGQNGTVKKTYLATLIDGKTVTDELVEESVVVKPINQRWLIGTKNKTESHICQNINLESIKQDVCWPVPGGKISCGWLGYPNHFAIDIAASNGTSIIAPLSGKVIFSGWKGAYGNCIMIRHSNNIVTLFAHNSQNLVSVGDEVVKGNQIGYVGRTGNASGAHCHVAFFVDGVAQNPMLFFSDSKKINN